MSPRSGGPRSAFEALLAATVPADGDPPVPLIEGDPLADLMPIVGEQSSEPVMASLLTPAQQAEMRARRGG